MHAMMVLADSVGTGSPAIRFAARLAAWLDASLTALRVDPPPEFTMPVYGSAALLPVIETCAGRRTSAACEAAMAFGVWTAGLGVRRSAWQTAAGYVPDVVARVANWHDAIVLDSDPARAWGSVSRLGLLMLKARLPCVIVPPGELARPGPATIALAWNGSPECIRAIRASMPLLRRASRVVLLRGDEKEQRPDSAWNHPDITAWLSTQDVDVSVEPLRSDDDHAGHALLEATSRWSADLLVAGAYGRSRLSEWWLGGTTRHLLQYCDVPLLMRH